MTGAKRSLAREINWRPDTEIDPAQIERYRKERLSLERKARRLTAGTRRSEVERILPHASFKDIPLDVEQRMESVAAWAYEREGIKGWYLLNAHFICTATYSWSGRARSFDEELEKFTSFQRLKAPPTIIQVRLSTQGSRPRAVLPFVERR